MEGPQEASELALYLSLHENNQSQIAWKCLKGTPGPLYMGHMPTDYPLTLYYLSMPLMKNIMLTH